MKNYLLHLSCLLFLFSCRKNVDVIGDINVDAVKNYLSARMDGQDFALLDWNKTMIIEEPEDFVRVGFLNKDFGREFLLVKFFNRDSIEGAKRISIASEPDSLLSGSLAVSSLDKREFNLFKLIEGEMMRERPADGGMAIVEDEGPYSPKLLMKIYPSEAPSRPTQATEYMNISRAYDNAVRATSQSYYYSQSRPEQKQAYGGGGSGTGSTSTSRHKPAPTILVDIETGYQKAPVDIAAFINCFNNISDQNAMCTVELFVDIPVDSDPQVLFDWGTNSPGHTFLRLTKVSAGKKMVQHIGFYPANSFKTTLTTAPIPGKFVDNGNHEYNAGIKMNVTPANFRKVLGFIQLTAKAAKYSIDKYNCTNFALAAFNSVRMDDPIEPPLVHIPNTMNITGSLTPQGLYLELFKRKKSDANERPNIIFPGQKTSAGPSISPCK